jgi:hypothetical protein
MDENDFKRLLDESAADTQRRFSHAEFRRLHAVEEKTLTLEESVHRLQARMDRLEAMTATQ